MNGIIPRPFIDDLLDRIDIVEVIDHRVKLKKSGKNYSACCPFHDEKSPSFTVSPDKQFYYCFGCGATGNAIGFLMEYERVNFPDAIENLAKHAGLDVPHEDTNNPKQREREQAQERARNTLYSLMEAASDYYQQQLRQHELKDRPVDYLKRRGLSGQIAKAFGIGFAPPGWDNLSVSLGTSNEKQERLLEAGMLIHNEDKERLYDRFRDRIMFPIRDTRGRVIGFGGRVLPDDDTQGRASGAGGRKAGAAQPKYLNSPETPIFSKGKELYGLFEARQAYKQLPRLLVVEGYMDVVALAQYGIRYGVATLGTACGEDHLARAFRFTNEIVFCFDGDEAGRKAARRAMENALPTMEDGRQVKFLYLPEGEDPDTLIRQIGTDKFTRLIESATPLESFLFDALGQGLNTQSMEGRARLCKLAVPLLDKLPRGVYRELMFNQLANRTQLSIDALMTLLNELPEDLPATGAHSPHTAPLNNQHKLRPQPLLSSDHHHKPAQKKNRHLPADELALALLLFQPGLAQVVSDIETLRHSSNAKVTLLAELIDLLSQRPNYTSGQILGHWQGTYGAASSEYLQQLLAKGVLFHHINTLNQHQKVEDHFNPEKEFADALSHLQKQQQHLDCAAIIQQLNSKPIGTWSAAEKQLYNNAIAAKANYPDN